MDMSRKYINQGPARTERRFPHLEQKNDAPNSSFPEISFKMTWRTWVSYIFRLSKFQTVSVLGKDLGLKTYTLDKCWLLWFPRVLMACDFHPVFLNFFARKYYVEFWKLQWWWSRFLISQTLSNPFWTLRSPFVAINWHCCSCSLYSFTTAIPVKIYKSIKSWSALQTLEQTVKYYWWTEPLNSMKQSPSKIWTPADSEPMGSLSSLKFLLEILHEYLGIHITCCRAQTTTFSHL